MATDQSIVGELVQKRTPNSKTYLLADGSYRAIFHGGPVHYEDETGNQRNINTTLLDEGDLDVLDLQPSKDSAAHVKEKAEKAKSDKRQGKFNRDLFDYMAAMVPFDLQLPRVWKRGYTIGKGADKITFKPVGASPAKGHLNPDQDNVLEYQDAWNDTDVLLQVLPTGMKETLVLKSNEAPTSFRFEVSGIDTITELKLQPPWLEDACGVRRDVVQNIIQESGKAYVELVADVAGLEYPVQIDPTISLAYSTGTTLIREGNVWPPTQDGGVSSGRYIQKGAYSSGYTYRHTDLVRRWVWDIPVGAVVTGVYIQADILSITNQENRSVQIGWVTWPLEYDRHAMYLSPVDTLPDLAYENAMANFSTGPVTFPLSLDTFFTFTGTDGVEYVGTRMAISGAAQPTLVKSNYLQINHTLPYTIHVDYVAPPTAPTLTSPNGGESWSGEHTISWNAATDPEGNQLQYHIQLSLDNGQAWSDIVALTAQGVTSYVHDFSGYAESSICLIRVRAYNGSAYGDWDQSDGVFSIQHNVSPSKPTNLAPAGGKTLDRAQPVVFSWQHNDSNGDPQSKFDLRCRLQGEAVWNEISVITNLQQWEAPAGFFSHGIIEWEVRTYDQADLYSPWSDQAVFLAGEKPSAPIILAPGVTVTGPTPTTQWSSSGQGAFQHQVLQSGSVIWDSGENFSTNKAQTVGIDLQDGLQYSIQVRIKNADGLWSDWASVVVDVTYTPPAEPIISTSTGLGYIQVNITNPEPTGSQPIVARNEVWRRELGGNWIRLVMDAGTSWADYTPASGVAHEYRARAVAGTGVASYSQAVVEQLHLTGVWLHDVTDPEGTVYQFKRDGSGKDEDWENRTELLQYQGRTLPVAERDETERHSMSLKLQLLKNTTDYQTLKSLLDRKGTICYRDGSGRRMFGVIPRHFTSDQIGLGHVASFQIHRIDFSEGV